MKVIAREEVESLQVATRSRVEEQEPREIQGSDSQAERGPGKRGQVRKLRGKSYDMEQVKKDLNDRFKHFQTQEATTDKLEKILEARERNLEAARRKLDVMLAANVSMRSPSRIFKLDC